MGSTKKSGSAPQAEPSAASEPPAAPAGSKSLDERVREMALALGFDVVGVARADEPLGIEHERYRDFIARGLHGSMAYLEAHAEVRRRVDTPEILAGAKSILCVGLRYARTRADEAGDPAIAKGVARYARGRDYHGFMRKRLRRLAEGIRGLAPGVQARALCDIEPVMERVWAARSGIGFVGKHGLVITPGQGSYQLLGEVVTTLPLVPGTPMAERCGTCTRCLDVCPTGAFEAPFVLDPRRCIAYLTIEAHEAPPQQIRPAMGEHLFGCDDCQDVCPFNRTAPPPLERTQPFRPLDRWADKRLSDLVTLDEEQFDTLSRGTPLRRARREGIARNAAVVAANRLRGQADRAQAEDAREALGAALVHDDSTVREIAAWALGHPGGEDGS
jgi:epoxyqueuosine reductase